MAFNAYRRFNGKPMHRLGLNSRSPTSNNRNSADRIAHLLRSRGLNARVVPNSKGFNVYAARPGFQDWRGPEPKIAPIWKGWKGGRDRTQDGRPSGLKDRTRLIRNWDGVPITYTTYWDSRGIPKGLEGNEAMIHDTRFGGIMGMERDDLEATFEFFDVRQLDSNSMVLVPPKIYGPNDDGEYIISDMGLASNPRNPEQLFEIIPITQSEFNQLMTSGEMGIYPDVKGIVSLLASRDAYDDSKTFKENMELVLSPQKYEQLMTRLDERDEEINQIREAEQWNAGFGILPEDDRLDYTGERNTKEFVKTMLEIAQGKRKVAQLPGTTMPSMPNVFGDLVEDETGEVQVKGAPADALLGKSPPGFSAIFWDEWMMFGPDVVEVEQWLQNQPGYLDGLSTKENLRNIGGQEAVDALDDLFSQSNQFRQNWKSPIRPKEMYADDIDDPRRYNKEIDPNLFVSVAEGRVIDDLRFDTGDRMRLNPPPEVLENRKRMMNEALEAGALMSSKEVAEAYPWEPNPRYQQWIDALNLAQRRVERMNDLDYVNEILLEGIISDLREAQIGYSDQLPSDEIDDVMLEVLRENQLLEAVNFRSVLAEPDPTDENMETLQPRRYAKLLYEEYLRDVNSDLDETRVSDVLSLDPGEEDELVLDRHIRLVDAISEANDADVEYINHGAQRNVYVASEERPGKIGPNQVLKVNRWMDERELEGIDDTGYWEDAMTRRFSDKPSLIDMIVPARNAGVGAVFQDKISSTLSVADRMKFKDSEFPSEALGEGDWYEPIKQDSMRLVNEWYDEMLKRMIAAGYSQKASLRWLSDQDYGLENFAIDAEGKVRLLDYYGSSGDLRGDSEQNQIIDLMKAARNWDPKEDQLRSINDTIDGRERENTYMARKPVSVVVDRSKAKGKKLRATFTYSDGTRKTTNFGGSGYEDFTIHKDPIRKKRYLNRHQTREDWNDPTTAGALSRWILWNDETLSGSFEDYIRRFDLNGDLKVKRSGGA